MTKRALVFPLLVMGFLLITWKLRYGTFAWVPIPVFLAALIAHTHSRPLPRLAILALVCELLGGLWIGLVSGAIFLPWLVKRLAWRMEVNLSLWFFGYILGVTSLQVAILSAAAWRGWQFFPWQPFLVSTLASAAAVFGFLVVHSFSLPSRWLR